LVGAVRIILTGMTALAASAPALAADATVLPDPSGLTLLALGVTGLILGRRAAARKSDED
jgi:hypothetical protein